MENIQDILSKIEEVKNDILNLEEKSDYRNGIACPNCGRFNDTVVDSRENKNGFRIRSRKCIDCAKYWKTIEIIYS